MENSTLRQIIRESIQNYIREIDEVAEVAATEARIRKMEEAIEERKNLINMEGLEETMHKMIDKKKIKEIEKEIKHLEKSLEKYKKQLEKMQNKGKKSEESESEETKEMVDEMASDIKDNMEENYMEEEKPLNESFLYMQKLAGVITEAQYKAKMQILSENEQNNSTPETTEVTNPDDLSKTKAFKNGMEAAKTELEKLEKDNPKPANAKEIANIIYNTAAHEVHKLREKYKTDAPVSDFAKKSLNHQFEWDDKKVQMDPLNKTAQDYMRRAEKFIRVDDKAKIK